MQESPFRLKTEDVMVVDLTTLTIALLVVGLLQLIVMVISLFN